eukprot:CAMPEP_0168481220 /NCGR_PEP_ID=MMETSP0228-20121227/64399_1 /TAXON_ID=133427 /ORGANISM="Protoceratium reticulatum, Strain CCCM 535 (=CCMP 1889)" /LENGTH=138 /DNA_ID=CAMNT_0008497581 /DNA_START=54 /DNA_END=467 /DNA_ORIENTATION=+
MPLIKWLLMEAQQLANWMVGDLGEVTNHNGIGVRKDPAYPGSRTEQVVKEHALFIFVEKRTVLYCGHVITFFRLADANGWLHNFDVDNPIGMGTIREVSRYQNQTAKQGRTALGLRWEDARRLYKEFAPIIDVAEDYW